MLKKFLICLIFSTVIIPFSIAQRLSALNSNIASDNSASISYDGFDFFVDNLAKLTDNSKRIIAIREFLNNSSELSICKKGLQTLIKILEIDSLSGHITRLSELDSLNGNKYSPIISDQGQSVYFCLFQNTDKSHDENIFQLSYLNNKVSSIYPIMKLNTPFSESITYVDSSNSNMIVFGLFPNSIGGGDIYHVRASNGQFFVNPFPEPINSKYFDCDGYYINDTTILIVSDRPGVLGTQRGKWNKNKDEQDQWGNTDIFISTRINNKWTVPENIGSRINTDKSERSPFLSADGNILFFSSNGHNGHGGMDVYASLRLSKNSWTHWSNPINLGKNINTEKDEWGFSFSEKLSLGYYSNNIDIFRIKIPEPLIEEPVPLISKLNNENLQSKIEQNSSNHPDRESEQSSVVIDSSLNTLTVFFNFNSTELDKIFIESLNKIVDYLKSLETKSDFIEIEIKGHTDSIGKDRVNKILSEKRAIEVKKFLKKNGFHENTIKIKGLGKLEPISTNETPEGRAKNRRAEIIIK